MVIEMTGTKLEELVKVDHLFIDGKISQTEYEKRTKQIREMKEVSVPSSTALDEKGMRKLRLEIIIAMLTEDPVLTDQVKVYVNHGD